MSVNATPAAGALRQLVRTEFVLFTRERARMILAVGFPLLLLVIFGSIPFFRRPQRSLGGLTTLDLYVPILLALAVAMLSLVALPMVLAGYRERGVLRRLRTTPAGPERALAAQLLVNIGVLVVTSAVVLAVAVLAYHVVLPQRFGAYVLSLLLASLALLATGLVVASVAPTAKAAQIIGLLVFYPLMFFAGLWLPLPSMPPVLRDISLASPLGAAVQAMQDASQGSWPHPVQLLTMVAYALVFGLAAARLFCWE